jgi:hypothetical protein
MGMRRRKPLPMPPTTMKRRLGGLLDYQFCEGTRYRRQASSRHELAMKWHDFVNADAFA